MKQALETGGALAILRRLRRRHVAWAAFAVLVSVAVHLFIMLRFPGITFREVLRAALRDRQVPIRLQDVRVAPELFEAETRPGRLRPEAATAGEVTGEAAAFRRRTDVGVIEPRAVAGGVLAAEQPAPREPAPAPRPLWEPRQELLMIQERVSREEIKSLPRRYVADIARVPSGPDVVPPADRSELRRDLLAAASVPEGDETDVLRILLGRPPVAGRPRAGGPPPPVPEVRPMEPEARKLTEEPPPRITRLKPLERLLKASVYTYHSARDAAHAYCRIEIQRLGPEALPVLPKDLVLVEDCSASMTEQKLHFCREGLTRALASLGPRDRFNVVEFRDAASRCFPGWAPVNAETTAAAREFIGAMRSAGNTDIFGSLLELLKLSRTEGRPVLMLVVSDGVPTVGLTDSTRIIEAFSETNRGAVSVFTLGTYLGANAYLLDLLSYRNRGDTHIVPSDRWRIPDDLERRAREISRPVLADVRFRFAGQSACEVYPVLTSNLYLDRPLVLYGRYPRDVSRLIFQAVGQAGDVPCDMVFDLDLSRAPGGEKSIRTLWAWQKVYHLIGEHTRTRNPAMPEAIRQVAHTYGIRVPYAEELAP